MKYNNLNCDMNSTEVVLFIFAAVTFHNIADNACNYVMYLSKF
jgi:hypothetical protein